MLRLRKKHDGEASPVGVKLVWSWISIRDVRPRPGRRVLLAEPGDHILHVLVAASLLQLFEIKTAARHSIELVTPEHRHQGLMKSFPPLVRQVR